MARELHRKPSTRNNFDNRLYRRVRFRSCGTVGYGPTMWVKSRKGGDVLHNHVSKACQRRVYGSCRQQRRYQGRGTKRTIFLLVERGGPIGKVLVHRWLPECYRQMQQGLSDTVVHQGVYISRIILLLRSYGSQGRLNKSMERKMCLTHVPGVYPSQSQAEDDIQDKI